MLEFEDWGLIDYKKSWDLQNQKASQVFEQKKLGLVVFCSHSEVITCGRKTSPEDIYGWEGEILEVNRGGRATYHGPSQLVVYWIYNLKHPMTPKGLFSDIPGHLRSIEKVFIETLGSFFPTQLFEGRTSTHGNLEDTGVWCNGKKLVSIGVGVKNFVTTHGAALNFESDPNAFRGIKPCGFSPEVMSSVWDLAKSENRQPPHREIFLRDLKNQITGVYDVS